MGNLPPPPLSFGFQGRQVRWLRSLLYFFLLPKLAQGRGSSSGKGRFRGCWHEAGRCPQRVWGLVGGLGRRLAPGACPLLAPHTVQFIHEPPGPALEGAVGKGFSGESAVGQRLFWGEEARFVPPGLLHHLERTVLKLWRLVPQERRAFEKWKGEVRGASCPWGSVLPPAWIPWAEVWQLGTPLPPGFPTRYHSLASTEA